MCVIYSLHTPLFKEFFLGGVFLHLLDTTLKKSMQVKRDWQNRQRV